jgi:biotin carboxyl carrier protein
MDLIVRHGERVEKVRVRKVDSEGASYEVTIGERVYHVDAANPRPGLQSLRIDGSHHEVAVRRLAEEGKYWVSAAHGSGSAPGPVEVTDPLTHLAAQALGAKGGRRAQRVLAYMPGRVVGLLVQEGEAVTAGQGVVVLEAMKMQNEIQAESDGTVTRIHVQPGQAVEGGDPLFEVE